MTARYLLDTNVVSEPLRPRPAESVLERLADHGDELAIPALVWHELWFGCRRLRRSRRRDVIERYLDAVVGGSMVILPYDADAAGWHAAERARLGKRGQPPPFVDGQIAAIAHTCDLVVVTANRADFRRFREVRVETW